MDALPERGIHVDVQFCLVELAWQDRRRVVISIALVVAVVASLSPQNTKRREWKERIEGITSPRLGIEVGQRRARSSQDIKAHENWSRFQTNSLNMIAAPARC